MNCLSCHQPHASANRGLLVKDQQANMAFCKTCHAEGPDAVALNGEYGKCLSLAPIRFLPGRAG